MTPKEQTRLQVLNSLLAEHMTLDQAATLMGVGPRHTRRMLAVYRERGAAALAHGHRGRRAPNATPDALAADVVHLAGTRYARANHTHLSELLSEREGIEIGRSTLRRILVNAGLSSPRQRRPPKHRVRRQRMPREGMLIQMDGSHHPWLGDQVPPFTLLIAVDDATGTVVDAIFCQQEDAHNYFLLMQSLIESCGRPVALYTDRHGVFRHTPGSGLPGMPTQFSRAMEELGIQMIFALSPQGKGRVERAAGTFQDRLVTELRLANAGSILEANRVLKQFLPRFNQALRGSPAIPRACIPASGPRAASGTDPVLQAQEKSGQGQHGEIPLHTLQLLPGPEHPSYAGAAVEVLESLDGRLSVRHEGRIVPAQEAPPNPVFLRNGSGRSTPVPVPPSGANGLGEPWTTTLGPLDSRAKYENDHGTVTDPVAPASKPKAASARKPTFLQKERWKAIQKARRKGMSLRAIERDLGINRATVRKYLDSEGPPTRPPRAGPTMSASDTMAT